MYHAGGPVIVAAVLVAVRGCWSYDSCRGTVGGYEPGHSGQGGRNDDDHVVEALLAKHLSIIS